MQTSGKPLKNLTMLTGYVVNEDRTKLLMRFHDQIDQWLPAAGWLNEDEQPQIAILERVAENVGVVARHVDGITRLTEEHSFVLEAAEADVSAFVLEEEYDAQWLTKEQILACTCIHTPAKVVAQSHLI